MIRQYAQTGTRARTTETPRGPMQCGVLPIGKICRLGGQGPRAIIEAWQPRDYATWDGINRQMATKRIRGGHIAWVRCLATGARFRVSGAWLIDNEESDT